MRKRVLHIILLSLLPYSLMWADTPVHENILKVSFGGVWQVDPYLSAFRYNGLELGIGNEWWQDFHPKGDSVPCNWSHVGRMDVRAMRLLSPAKNNAYYSIGTHAGWGAYYRWQPVKGLQLHLGPYLELEYVARLHNTQFNKPYSMDLGVDVEAMTGISYSFTAKRTSYRVRYLVRCNLIGYEFMPDYWQSYYEITEGIKPQHLCSGLWNRQLVRHEVTMDFQFPHSTWRLGVEHEFLHYGTSDMDNVRQQVHLIVGCIFRYKIHPAVRFEAL
ncbi:MAG: hypothetical protein J6T85_01955 [Paludibacteraceae bacterium]|nr:hypothetical protein [Paludibacteraceae bacterium]